MSIDRVTRLNKTFNVLKLTTNGVFWNVADWEKNTYKILNKYLDSDHSYIDVGAWIGPTVLFGAQKAKHCYAIEPDKKSFSELLFNLYINPSIKKKVTPILGALYNRDGKLNFGNNFLFGDSRSSIFHESAKHRDETDCFTLKTIVDKYKINDVNFIKMDIEGAEFFVLPSIESFLKDNKINLLVSLHQKLLPENIKNQKVGEVCKVIENFNDVRNSNGSQISRKVLFNAQIIDIICRW